MVQRLVSSQHGAERQRHRGAAMTDTWQRAVHHDRGIPQVRTASKALAEARARSAGITLVFA